MGQPRAKETWRGFAQLGKRDTYNLVFEQEDLLRIIFLLDLGDHGWLVAAEVVLSLIPLTLAP